MNISALELIVSELNPVVLEIASKIEPPTHSHEILISSTLLITDKSLPAQDYKVPLYLSSCSTASFITVNHWFGFQLNRSKVQGYQIPTRGLSRHCT